MKMVVHTAPQGSDEWLAERTNRYNAGDAAAMLGCDPNGRTRTDLLDSMVKGFTPEAGDFKQKMFDKGHQVEAVMRKLAEELLGEDLYPLVGSIEVPGLKRRVGASFDGVKMARDINFEAKSLNEALAAALPVEDDPDANDAANLPKGYRVQLEQQQLVDGATRTLFGAGEFHPDGSTKSQRWCWYASDPELRAEILAGWAQFEADLATHTPKAHQERPTGEKQEALPALFIQVEGRIVSSNLPVWREAALAHIARINKDLKTDEDFADAKEAVKWCDESAKKIKLLKEQTLAQMVDVNELVKTLDTIVGGLDRTRIDLGNLVTSRETTIRNEVAARGVTELAAYMAKLNERIGKPYMPLSTSPLIAADFQKAIKSKRTIKSLNDSVDAELARCKIAASGIADRIQVNLRHLAEHCAEHMGLFADERTLVLKECDDFKAIADGRVSAAKAAEEKREADQRERIRAEEAENLRQAEAEKNRMRLSEISGIRQQVIIASVGRAGVRKGGTIECIRETLAETEAWVIEEANFGPLTATAQGAKDDALAKIRALLTEAETPAAPAPAAANQRPAFASSSPLYADLNNPGRNSATGEAEAAPASAPQAAAANSSTVVPIRPAIDNRPNVRLGQIGEKLGFTLTADFLKQLGFEPVATEKSAKLYRASDEDLIYEALVAHIRTVAAKAKQRQAA